MSEKLLNTAEAARFLRVSEASIRRWSDSGLLRARRVGRRRERRFTETDLKKFLASETQAAAPVREAPQTEVFVGGTRLGVHSHIATFYNHDEGRLRLAIPFFRDGLKQGQPCFLAAAGDVREAYIEALRSEEGVDVAASIREGTFVIADGPGASVEAALEFWERNMSRALAAGPTLIRVVGEMVSERTVFPTDAEMIRYEVAFNGIAKRFPSVTLCQYDVRSFPGEVLFQALRAHPDLYQLGIASFLN